jgi:hypothetical protein
MKGRGKIIREKEQLMMINNRMRERKKEEKYI